MKNTVQFNSDYKTGKWFNCTHHDSTNYNLDDQNLTEIEKQYLKKLAEVTGAAFIPTMHWYVATAGGNNSWESNGIFKFCNASDPVVWFWYKRDVQIRGTSIEKIAKEELTKRGVSVNFSTKADVPVFTTISYSGLAAAANAAVNANSGVTPAFTALSNAYDFGQLDDDIKNFMANPDKATNIRDSVKMLGYVIPTNNEPVDLVKMKQIYWGAFYLSKFPIPGGILGADCGQIGQTLIQLAAEKANLKQSDLDQLFTVYSEDDVKQKMQAVADLTTVFNGMYAQQNCTAAQTSGGNDVLKYVLYGLGGIFVIVIGMKILRHKK